MTFVNIFPNKLLSSLGKKHLIMGRVYNEKGTMESRKIGKYDQDLVILLTKGHCGSNDC